MVNFTMKFVIFTIIKIIMLYKYFTGINEEKIKSFISY